MLVPRQVVSLFCMTLILALPATLFAEPLGEALEKIQTQAELEQYIAASTNASLQQTLREASPAILKAIAERPHVAAVMRTIESAPGKFEKVNITPEALKKFTNAELPLFDSLKLIDLSIPNAGPHAHRKVDPYDAAFFEHVSHISALESLVIIATKANDEWITPLGKLTHLKTLRFINNGKLTDAGLEKLAGLRQLESFGFIGTGMQGHAFAKFEGWSKINRMSYRGSSIDDQGLQLLCQRFPNLENLILAHAKFTDAGAEHLAQLTKLKGLEIGTRNAKPQCLQHIAKLPLEYLQIGDGLDTPEGIALIKAMPTLRRLTLTNATPLSDADLKVVAGMTQLEHLELGKLPITEERLSLIKEFAFLKSMRLVPPNGTYPPEMQAKLQACLPKVDLKLQ
jgi:hypothetical protein